MAKRLFLIIILGIIGIISNPIYLSAFDEVVVTGMDTSKVVETLPLPEPVKEPELVEQFEHPTTVAAASSNNQPVSDSVSLTPAPAVQVAPSNSISIAGRTLEIVDVNDTAINSGNHVNKFGDKFLYGHNSAAVFGNLVYVGVGNVFTVAYGGASTNYQVAEVVVYEKKSDTTLSANGVDYRMKAIVNGRGRYDMVLMTCS